MRKKLLIILSILSLLLSSAGQGYALRPMAAKFILKDATERKELDFDYVISAYSTMYNKRDLTCDMEWLINHIEVGKYIALSIAKRLNVSVRDMEKIEIAFNFHDIGKLYDKEQWESIFASNEKFDLKNDSSAQRTIEEHAFYSIYALEELGIKFEEDIDSLIRNHHSPDCIKEANLRFLCEIISLADMVDGVTSNRPYRDNDRYKNFEEIFAPIKSIWQLKFSKGHFSHIEIYDAFLDFASTDMLWRSRFTFDKDLDSRLSDSLKASYPENIRRLPEQHSNIQAIFSAA